VYNCSTDYVRKGSSVSRRKGQVFQRERVKCLKKRKSSFSEIEPTTRTRICTASAFHIAWNTHEGQTRPETLVA
jgi:hypothetical protein